MEDRERERERRRDRDRDNRKFREGLMMVFPAQ